MRWGLLDRIAFAAIMTIYDMELERKKSLFNAQKYYREMVEDLSSDSIKLCDQITDIVQKASSIYVPGEITEGIRYLPLYAFGLVLNDQKRITKDQKAVLELYFKHLHIPFNQSDFVRAMIDGRKLNNFNSVIEITKHSVGSFWVQFFRAIYKAGTPQDYQAVMDCICTIIMRFSLLESPHNEGAIPICERLLEASNHQLHACIEMPTGQIDWFGCIPAAVRNKQMNSIYQMLIQESGISKNLSVEELIPMVDLCTEKCICDLILSTKCPDYEKPQIADKVMSYMQLPVEMSGAAMLTEIANNTSFAQETLSVFDFKNEVGMFWQILIIMGAQARNMEAAFGVIYHLCSILIQVEEYLVSEYRFLGKKHIARHYMGDLITAFNKAMTGKGK